jgi:hypothetical protein
MMSDDRGFEWLKRVLALEDELGTIPPIEFGGGATRRRVLMARYSSLVDANGSPAGDGTVNDEHENDLGRRS